jgi:hypothetical protein
VQRGAYPHALIATVPRDEQHSRQEFETMPSTFFTNESFFSLAGATAIVFVVCNTLQRVFNFNPKWFALMLSELVAIFGTWSAARAHVPSDYLIAVLNGCLIYSAAGGGTAIASSVEAGQPKGMGGGLRRPRGFVTSWF